MHTARKRCSDPLPAPPRPASPARRQRTVRGRRSRRRACPERPQARARPARSPAPGPDPSPPSRARRRPGSPAGRYAPPPTPPQARKRKRRPGRCRASGRSARATGRVVPGGCRPAPRRSRSRTRAALVPPAAGDDPCAEVFGYKGSLCDNAVRDAASPNSWSRWGRLQPVRPLLQARRPRPVPDPERSSTRPVPWDRRWRRRLAHRPFL